MGRTLNKAKDQKVKSQRGASVEDIVTDGKLLATRENKNYPDQYLLIYEFEGYAWVVVVGEKPDRFITHYKSRKFKKEFGL